MNKTSTTVEEARTRLVIEARSLRTVSVVPPSWDGFDSAVEALIEAVATAERERAADDIRTAFALSHDADTWLNGERVIRWKVLNKMLEALRGN